MLNKLKEKAKTALGAFLIELTVAVVCLAIIAHGINHKNLIEAGIALIVLMTI